MACQGTICLPEPICSGWLSSPYTWYLIVITLVAGFIVYNFLGVYRWFINSITVPLYPGHLTIAWSYGFIYIMLLIAMIVLSYNTHNPYSRCFVIVYTLLIIATITWGLSWGYEMLEFSLISIFIVLLMAIWLLWLSDPHTRGNMFSHIIIWLYTFAVLIGIYYNIAIYITK